MFDMEAFGRRKVALKYRLLGAGYNKAVKAMNLMLYHHIGKRVSGAPEASHLIDVACHVITYRAYLPEIEETICTALLHDILEDYLGNENTTILQEFGQSIDQSVRILSKAKDYNNQLYYYGISRDLKASIVKGCDRFHNQSTMINAFDRERQLKIINETEELVIPMLKQAREQFIEQELVYENLKLGLVCQVNMLKAVNGCC